jgi:hypothetical protein
MAVATIGEKVDDAFEIAVDTDLDGKAHFIRFEPAQCNELHIEVFHGDSRLLDAFDNYVELLEEEGFGSELNRFFLNHKVLIILDTDVPLTPATIYAAFLLLVKEACELSISYDELKSIAATFDLQTGFAIESYLS